MGRKPYVPEIKTVRMWMIYFNDTKTFYEAFWDTYRHLGWISCESCESELLFVLQEQWQHYSYILKKIVRYIHGPFGRNFTSYNGNFGVSVFLVWG